MVSFQAYGEGAAVSVNPKGRSVTSLGGLANSCGSSSSMAAGVSVGPDCGATYARPTASARGNSAAGGDGAPVAVPSSGCTVSDVVTSVVASAQAPDGTAVSPRTVGFPPARVATR